MTLDLPSWNARQPTGLENGDDGSFRKHVLAQMISVQLLASCFTSPQKVASPASPSSRFSRKNQFDEGWLDAEPVSTLRQHMQWKHSPAFGHQARNNSVVSLWPERDDLLSREALLAEKVSLKRRLRRREDEGAKEKTATELHRLSELSRERLKCRHLVASRRPRRFKTLKQASSYEFPNGFPTFQGAISSPKGRFKDPSTSNVTRGLRSRKLSDDHRWLFEPFLRSENHPVLVQPVKDYVVKRWRGSRLRSRGRALKGPNIHRTASSISRDSIQLSQGTQVMTTIRDKCSSLAYLAGDNEDLSSPLAGSDRILIGTETSQESTG